MIDFEKAVIDSYEFCYEKSYPELPLDAVILEDIADHYEGWGDVIDLSNPHNYDKWLGALHFELDRQCLKYRREE